MPAAAGVNSQAEYNIMKQISLEDVGGWHARLPDLYNRAYPGHEFDTNLPLIQKFVTQLINREVGKFVFERDPAAFAETGMHNSATSTTRRTRATSLIPTSP
jgi:hypothetical protein